MKSKRFSKFFISFLVLGVFFVWQPILGGFFSDLLEITFFDVGEGDSILISPPIFQGILKNRLQILIDGSPEGDIAEKIARGMPFFDKKIELIILTHPDKDHIGGLFEVLERFKVECVLMPKIDGIKEEKEILISFEKLLKEKNVKILTAREGQKLSFSDKSSFLIFWPPPNLISKDTNDFSIVTKFSFGQIDFLFTGDAPKKVEYQLLAKNFDIQSEVLKIAHHGSRFSTSKYFLEKVSPQVAVISVGENSYGHPAQEVLDLISKYGIKLFRTDKIGDIKIFSDGKGYEIKLK